MIHDSSEKCLKTNTNTFGFFALLFCCSLFENETRTTVKHTDPESTVSGRVFAGNVKYLEPSDLAGFCTRGRTDRLKRAQRVVHVWGAGLKTALGSRRFGDVEPGRFGNYSEEEEALRMHRSRDTRGRKQSTGIWNVSEIVCNWRLDFEVSRTVTNYLVIIFCN